MTKQRLFLPHLVFALLIGCFCIAHQEYAQPLLKDACAFLQNKPAPPKVLLLEGGGAFLYANKTKDSVHQVYWILSEQEFWRMNQLDLGKERQGHYADHFKKNSQGTFTKVASWEKKVFSSIPFSTLEEKGLRRLFGELYAGVFPAHLCWKSAYEVVIDGLFPFLAAALLCPFLCCFSPKTSLWKQGSWVCMLIFCLKILQKMLFYGTMLSPFPLLFCTILYLACCSLVFASYFAA